MVKVNWSVILVGKIKYDNGDEYIGDWKYNMKDGQGNLEW